MTKETKENKEQEQQEEQELMNKPFSVQASLALFGGEGKSIDRITCEAQFYMLCY